MGALGTTRSAFMRLPRSFAALSVAIALGSPVFAANAPAAPTAPPPDRPVVPLWEAGAPGFEARRNEPEKVGGGNVSNIHNPSLTVYLPAKGMANGCAVIVCPGGGHRTLVIQKEGYEIADWLVAHGFTAFVLKNRLANDEANPAGAPQPYTVVGHALVDAQRAVRLVRSRAAAWNLDPAKVGIIGFSAGGDVAVLAGTRGAPGQANAADPIERQSSRPDFFGLIYAAGLARPDLVLNAQTPPVFIACGYLDRYRLDVPSAQFYVRCREAGVSAELHIYAGGDHGFAIRPSSNAAAATWIARFNDWLVDRKFIAAAKS
jgi:acetyl esterase/lipase